MAGSTDASMTATTSMTALMPMRPEVFAAYLPQAVARYADDNVASGRWTADEALARSQADFDALLPQGLGTPDNHLYEIQAMPDGQTVGFIWFAVVDRQGRRSAFVYDVEIEAAFRRRGPARAAFRALEPIVRALGLSQIGLHVFGHNPGALALYGALGYGVTGLNMQKTLPPGEAGAIGAINAAD